MRQARTVKIAAARAMHEKAAKAVGLASGATVIETNRAKLEIPALSADAAASWVAEGATLSAGDPTVAQITMTPSKLVAYDTASRELVDDANPQIAHILLKN